MIARRLRLVVVLVVLALAGGVLAGCDSDDDDGNGGNGGPDLEPTFMASNTSPGPRTLRLAPGDVAGELFEVRVLVTGIDDLYGAAFRIEFDGDAVAFVDESGAGSFLAASGVTTRFDAEVVEGGAGEPDELFVDATRVGDVAGVDSGTDGRLITLTFRAEAETTGTPLDFAGPSTRLVVVRTAAGQPPADLDDATLTWSGGTLVVTD